MGSKYFPLDLAAVFDPFVFGLGKALMQPWLDLVIHYIKNVVSTNHRHGDIATGATLSHCDAVLFIL